MITNESYGRNLENWDDEREAVSYTHLDVYKRQVPDKGRRHGVFHQNQKHVSNPGGFHSHQALCVWKLHTGFDGVVPVSYTHLDRSGVLSGDQSTLPSLYLVPVGGDLSGKGICPSRLVTREDTTAVLSLIHISASRPTESLFLPSQTVSKRSAISSFSPVLSSLVLS